MTQLSRCKILARLKKRGPPKDHDVVKLDSKSVIRAPFLTSLGLEKDRSAAFPPRARLVVFRSSSEVLSYLLAALPTATARGAEPEKLRSGFWSRKQCQRKRKNAVSLRRYRKEPSDSVVPFDGSMCFHLFVRVMRFLKRL